jgi:hypothetical protein
MDRIHTILFCSSISVFGAGASGQEALSIDDSFVDESPLVETILDDSSTPAEQEHNAKDDGGWFEPISYELLSALRAAEIDPSWISNRDELPSFDPNSLHRTTQSDDPLFVESWARRYAGDRGVRLTDTLSFSVGRTTSLRDGNISGSAGTLNADSTSSTGSNDHVSSLTQAEGEYDVYDLSLEWEAVKAGPVTISVLSGLKAIEANIGKLVTNNGDTTIDRVNRFAAIPMIGSGVRWEINDSLSFSGAALTQSIATGDTLMDFNASTDLRISQNVGFSAGYRIIRSSFEVGSVNTELNQEGLFARLQIRF